MGFSLLFSSVTLHFQVLHLDIVLVGVFYCCEEISPWQLIKKPSNGGGCLIASEAQSIIIIAGSTAECRQGAQRSAGREHSRVQAVVLDLFLRVLHLVGNRKSSVTLSEA